MHNPKTAGVDEAGRGPALGPLVSAIAVADDKTIAKLEGMGVKDSKLLTPAMRERLAKEIAKLCSVEIRISSPQEIDAALESDSTNLNWLEADSTIELIKKIDADKVIIDCPSNNIKAYCSYIKKGLARADVKSADADKNSKQPEIICEHKADLNNTIVGAASIIAKTTRDVEIEKIKKKIGIDFGSGYPSDPKTQDFLKQYWNKKEYSQYFRKSWDCWKRIRAQKSQMKLGEY